MQLEGVVACLPLSLYICIYKCVCLCVISFSHDISNVNINSKLFKYMKGKKL